MLDDLIDYEGDSRRRLVHAKLAPPQSRQQSRPLPLTLGVETTSLQFSRLEHLLQAIMTRAEGNVGEVVVSSLAGRGYGPEDGEVKRSRVEERKEMLMKGFRDGGKLTGEVEMAKGDVSAKE